MSDKKPQPSDKKPIKAYKDSHFINSPAGRPVRILSEYLAPLERFEHHKIRDTVVFFGSARIPSLEAAEQQVKAAEAGEGDPEAAAKMLYMSKYHEACRQLAQRLTEWSSNLKGTDRRFVIATGGGPGIMEAANHGACDGGGPSIGLGISLPFETSDNGYIDEDLNFQFHYFFMRKFWFSYIAKAFVVMPGGYGTMDELFEVMTLIQTAKMRKKVPIVLFGKEFWNDVINFDALVKYGTISPADLDLFLITDSQDEAFEYVTKGLMTYAWENPGGGM
jgi:uncharacterized protein (TIGR00730 family)